MAVGDVYNNVSASLATNSYINFIPATEITLHNIYCGAAAQLEWFDGANAVIIDTISTNGGWFNQAFHCTATKYIRVKNTGSAANFAGDGIVSK